MYSNLYHVFSIPKKNGKSRKICAPNDLLKHLQRALLDHGFALLQPHHAATGFVTGQSILDNASRHEKKRVVVTMDIQDFFPSTGFAAVHKVCHRLWDAALSPFAARFIAELCCNEGGLPIGSPASPAIANMVMLPVDLALTKAAEARGIVYSRYADDLTLSSQNDAAVRMIPFVGRVLKDSGYRLASQKTNIERQGRRQNVTGLVVNEKATMSRDMRRTLRAMVDHKATGRSVFYNGRNLDAAEFSGRLSTLKLSRPEEYATHRARLKAAQP
jgi:retron-type reverse transcriptase